MVGRFIAAAALVHAGCAAAVPVTPSLYQYKMCAVSSHLLGPHLQVNSGIPQNMTAIAAKMKQAGYKTHVVGKWVRFTMCSAVVVCSLGGRCC